MRGIRPIGARLASARPHDDGIERRRIRAELGARLLGETRQAPQIGRYVVLRPIGAGAMGVVYAAYDPELDRKVAIKVLDPQAQQASLDHRRLLREGQALAKLSDPNVVAVYDVGTVDDRVWIAMELVQGDTLRAWLEAAHRRWSEVLAVMLDAGRGLAEAHAAALVHRDFKPENVMIGDDGRVRVMDFGLARSLELERADEHEEDSHPGTHRSSHPTTALAGTPAYMAPEQLAGQSADALSDQFAYCVTFEEALSREPRVPKWLSAAVRRGMASAASDRWPGMSSLLRELERGQSRARRRRGAVWVGGALLVVGASMGGSELERRHRERSCEDRGSAVAEFWNGDTRQRLGDGLRATDVPHAEATAHAVVEIFDARAEQWRHAQVETCLDHDVRQDWDDDQLERALWCLEDRRLELEALAGILTVADRETTNRALMAASRLSDVARCRDPAVLGRLPAVPEERREAIRSVRERLAGLAGRYATGSSEAGVPASREAVDEAVALGWPPLVANARVLEASFLRRAAAYDDARAEAMTAYFEAVRIPDWDIAADAALVVVAISTDRHDQTDGTVWGRHAQVALERVDDTAGPRASALFNSLGLLHKSAGEYDEARAAHERARQIAVGLFGEDHPEVSIAMLNRASIDYETGDYPLARSTLERTVEIRERNLGPEHPDVAIALANLATVLEKTGHTDEGRALARRALAIEERSLGADHPRVATSLNNLAVRYNRAGDHAAALELHGRALAIREKHFGPDHPAVATSLANLAIVHQDMDDRAAAVEFHERAIVVRERALGPRHRDLADSLDNLGVLLIQEGDRERARTLIERGLAVRESALGPNHPDVAVSLTNLAALEEDPMRVVAIFRRVLEIRETALEPDHPEVARALTNLALELDLAEPGTVELLERAVAIFDHHPGVQPREAAARFGLARALAGASADATRVRGLAEAALRDHRTDGNAAQIARVERWLSERH
jgi:tetratricopeptide (TPR) repeat protein